METSARKRDREVPVLSAKRGLVFQPPVDGFPRVSRYTPTDSYTRHNMARILQPLSKTHSTTVPRGHF